MPPWLGNRRPDIINFRPLFSRTDDSRCHSEKIRIPKGSGGEIRDVPPNRLMNEVNSTRAQPCELRLSGEILPRALCCLRKTRSDWAVLTRAARGAHRTPADPAPMREAGFRPARVTIPRFLNPSPGAVPRPIPRAVRSASIGESGRFFVPSRYVEADETLAPLRNQGPCKERS